MKLTLSLAVASCLVCSVPAVSQGQGGEAPAPLQEAVAPNIPGVVAGGTKVQVIKTGFQGTEGPIALPDGSLIFTEPAANRINKIDKDDNITAFLENTSGANALAFDAKGRLIAVQADPMRTGVIYPKGSEAVLAQTFEGKPFGRPNDLVVDRRGGVYFTDSGTPSVYYIAPDGKVIKVADGFPPNGIQLSVDEKTLYINCSNCEYLPAFDVQPDGTLANRRDFAKYEAVTKNEKGFQSRADGLAVDSEGRVYIALQTTGVQVVSPQGMTLGIIPMPGGLQNLAFAGPDKKTLYVVGRGNTYKVQMLAQGNKGRAK